MQMDIHTQPFTLTTVLEKHVVHRVKHAIGMAAQAVRGVMVRLVDVNGERGGVDKACRIVVWLRRGGAVIVNAVDRDLYTAIDVASAKLRLALGRRLNRRRTLRREYATRRRLVWPTDALHDRLSAWSH